ncbi:MAG TPA: type II toxin-antitoxin system death-on-curing family toxin [Chloroflexota bacterium]|nr:type II toxin-antitoxin system death-on-curing family toxin [Chloroflexota bacterium]
MARIRYLSLLDVESLHAFIMERTGDPPSPLRDRGLLEAALMRPQMAAYYRDADLIEQAAILAVGISQAQSYIQGNKRTAFIVADVFLRLNGGTFHGDPLEMARRLEDVATWKGNEGEATANLADWLREQVTSG